MLTFAQPTVTDRLKFPVSNVFVYNFTTPSKYRIVENRGGTRSGKTYSILQCIAYWLFTGEITRNLTIKEGKATVVRKNKTTITYTSYEDFKEILTTNKLYHLVGHNKTAKTFTFEGRHVQFMGVDDPDKMRGYKSDILFINECTEITEEDFFQLQVRTNYITFLDFNPTSPYSWVNLKIEQERRINKKDVRVIVSTYKDNPYLRKEMVEEIEYLRKVDNERWKVYGLGKYGTITGLVYDNIEVEIIDKVEDVPYNWEVFGLDYGWNSPNALVNVNRWKQYLVIDEYFYKYRLKTSQLDEEFRNTGVLRNDLIIADNNEPRTTADLQNIYGWNMVSTEKFPGSVEYGVKLVKEFPKWYVTGRSINVLRELKLYMYEKDKEGNFTNNILKKFDHTLDPIRYCVMHNESTGTVYKAGRN